MFQKTDYSQSDFSYELSELTRNYNNLTRDAERCNRDNFGKLTALEAEYYSQAARVCEQILNMNPAEEAIRAKWQRRKSACLRIVDTFNKVNRPKPPVEEAPDKSSKKPGTPPAKTPAPSKDSRLQANAKADSGFVTKNACEEVSVETIQSWHQDKPWQNFAALSGMEDLKNRLMEEVAQMGWDTLDAQLKIKPTQRFFFYGPPGTGKSTIIQAFAHEMMEQDENFSFLKLEGSSIRGKYLGDSEKTVRVAFQEAIDNEPCLIFIDEIDELCRSRGDQKAEGYDTRTTVAFLQAIDNLVNSRKRVIFMGATNYPDRVDEAMMNRVKLVKVPLPDEPARVGFFSRYFGTLAIEDGFTFEDMADVTDNCSYRDLENVTEGISMKIRKLAIAQYKICDEDGNVDKAASDQAAANAVAEGKIPVTRAMFEESMEENPPSDKTGIRERLQAFEERVKTIKQS